MSTDIALSDQMKKAEVMAASSLLPESYRKQPANLLWAMVIVRQSITRVVAEVAGAKLRSSWTMMQSGCRRRKKMQ